MSDNTQQRIDALVKSNDILLFMKGSASFPMCGFSGRAIQILKACGVDPKSVVTVNVLEDDAIRQLYTTIAAGLSVSALRIEARPTTDRSRSAISWK